MYAYFFEVFERDQSGNNILIPLRKLSDYKVPLKKFLMNPNDQLGDLFSDFYT